MANPSVVIDIAAEYTGKKAFDKAGKSTVNLEKSVKSLGRTLGLTFSATAVLAYSKASVKAAAADQKAQQQLALALKNVGLGRDAATAEGYIQRIEKEYGIVDDKLRPAYSRLAIATQDTLETQRLLSIAMDISASTGKDLGSVTSALSKAFLGSNTALSKLGVGISKADLETKSFNEITKQLAATFAGAAVKSANSVSGSMDKLAIATNNAKETIGVGLITAFSNLAGNGDVDQAVSKIDSVSASLSKMIVVASKLKWYDWIIGGITGGTITDITKFKGMGNVPLTGGSSMDTQKADAIAKAKAAKEIAAAKSIAAAKAKAEKLAAAAKIKADKNAADNAAKLAKAGAMFDLDKIQIEAALKGKITDEETLRLQLQRAILNEDATLADALQKKLEASQRATVALQGQINGIKPLADPFSEWLKTLEEIAGTLSKILGMPINMTSSSMLNPNALTPGSLAGAGQQNPTVPVTVIPPSMTEPIPVVVAPTATPIPATNGSMAGLGGGGPFYGQPLPEYMRSSPAPVTVNVTVEGTVIAQQDLVKVVNDAVVEANTQGLSVIRPGGIGFRADEG
jgi:hypothetical protein